MAEVSTRVSYITNFPSRSLCGLIMQCRYTWRLNSMSASVPSDRNHKITHLLRNSPDKYEPFDIVTKKALTHALSESGIKFLEDDVEKLMVSYNSLKWCETFQSTRQHELTYVFLCIFAIQLRRCRRNATGPAIHQRS